MQKKPLIRPPYRFRACKGRNISVEFDHLPGRRISTRTTDMAAAVLFAEEYLRGNGLPSDLRKPLFRDYARDFFSKTGPGSLRQRHESFGKRKSDSYYKTRQSSLDKEIMPTFGQCVIDSITPRMVERWVLTFRGVKKDNLSWIGRNYVLDTLRIVLDEAVKDGLIPTNPARMCPKLSGQREGRRALTIEEQAKLFPKNAGMRVHVWGSLRWATYFSVMYDTGFRPGEVAALSPADIYRTPNGLAVATTHSVSFERREVVERVKTSGRGMERRVGLLDEVTASLVLALLKTLPDDETLLFRAKDGKPLSTSLTGPKFREVMEAQGYGGRGSVQYCLRHTFATERRGDFRMRSLQ